MEPFNTPFQLAKELKYVDCNEGHDFFKSPQLSDEDLQYIHSLLQMNVDAQANQSQDPKAREITQHIFEVLDQFNHPSSHSITSRVIGYVWSFFTVESPAPVNDANRQKIIEEIKNELNKEPYLSEDMLNLILPGVAGFGFVELTTRELTDSPKGLAKQDLYWKGLAEQIDCRLPDQLPLGGVKAYVLNYIKEYKDYILSIPEKIKDLRLQLFGYQPSETLPPEIQQLCASIRLERKEGDPPSAKRNEEEMMKNVLKLKEWKAARDTVIQAMALEDVGVLGPHKNWPLYGPSLKNGPRPGGIYTGASYEATLSEARVLPARIKETHHLQREALYLRNCWLSSICEAIGYNFKTMDFENNKLESLPEIEERVLLERLWIQRNQLKTIPASIGNALKLQELKLSYNQVEKLPESLFTLAELNTLLLDHNQIKKIPDTLGNLTKLTILTIDKNQLEALPDSIGNLKDLKSLYIHDNKLTSLPESIGDLENLEHLDLSGNSLRGLPKSIVKLRNLKFLGVDPGVVIPEELQEILRRNNP